MIFPLWRIFFTKLSLNMVLQQQQQYPCVSIPQYVQIQKPTTPVDSYVSPRSINTYSNIEYPVIPWLPPIGQTTLTSQIYPTISDLKLTATTTILQPTTTLVPLTAIPVLQPRLHFQIPANIIARQLTPQNDNGVYYKQYSVHQMNNGQSSKITIFYLAKKMKEINKLFCNLMLKKIWNYWRLLVWLVIT